MPYERDHARQCPGAKDHLIEDVIIAQALRVLSIALWTGGVAIVMTVLLPAIRRAQRPSASFAMFHATEGRFAAQARWTTALADVNSFYMAWRLDAWDRFGSTMFWWLRAMVPVWVLFMLMLFVIEPLFLDHFLTRRAEMDPEGTYRRVECLHQVLLALSLVTVARVVAGAQGLSIL